MATRKPLVVGATGRTQEIATGDMLPAASLPSPTTVVVTTTASTTTALTSDYNIVTNIASGAMVRLDGRAVQCVQNAASSGTLIILPPTGAKVGTYGTNAAVSIAAGSAARFVATSSTQLYAFVDGAVQVALVAPTISGSSASGSFTITVTSENGNTGVTGHKYYIVGNGSPLTDVATNPTTIGSLSTTSGTTGQFYVTSDTPSGPSPSSNVITYTCP